MARGFNTDVLFDGTTLHVQTEDRAGEHPVLETLVYSRGQILHQERSPYSDLAGLEDAEAEVVRRIDRQHRDVVRRARHGEFLTATRMTLAELMPTTTPLEEEIAEALVADGDLSPLELSFVPEGGRGLAGQLIVARPGSAAPVEGIAVRARLVGAGLSPARLWSGETGPDGTVQVAAALPEGVAGAVIFIAEGPGSAGRLRFEPALNWEIVAVSE